MMTSTLAPKVRCFSGIQPTGAPHVGNDLGAIRNYVALQDRYESIYCIVDLHALTTVHDADRLRRQTREMAAALLALGLDPSKCALFVQSHRPEVTELMWLFSTVTPVSWLQRTPTYKEKRANQPDDVNHGLLTYPVLQAADIVLYKASVVPVGKDQAAHLELSREIARAFNSRYGDTFPEPQAVHTDAPIVLGTDGARKMSKSIGNTIEIFAPDEEIRRQVMGMVTDTLRIKRTDPGHPERCNVCQMHRFFGEDYAEIWEGERTARTGCVDTKKLLVERLLRHYADARERYVELMAHPDDVDGVLEEGASRLRPIAQATIAEVHDRMGLR
jgi:tryptophanyl-tRNA synthetase